MTRTFVDAGVLIAAATGRDPIVRPAAIAILDDPGRAFLSSAFVRLEVLPKAIYNRKPDEAAFYEAFFVDVAAWAEALDEVVTAAATEAERHGLGALDALHVAAAVALGAEELVTTERPEKPIHRTTSVRVVSIRSLARL